MVFAITNLDLVVSGAITLLIPLFGVTFNLWRGAAIVAAGAAILVGQRL